MQSGIFKTAAVRTTALGTVGLMSIALVIGVLSGCTGKQAQEGGAADITFRDGADSPSSGGGGGGDDHNHSPTDSPTPRPTRGLDDILEAVRLSFVPTPANGAADVAVTQPLLLSFTEDLPTTLPAGALVTVTNLGTGEAVRLAPMVRTGNRILQFLPASGRWEEGVTYRFSVTSLTSSSGHSSLPISSMQFTTYQRTWFGRVPISTAGGVARNIHVASDGNGNAVAVWQKTYNVYFTDTIFYPHTDVYSARFKTDPTTHLSVWEAPVRLNTRVSSNATDPQIAMSRDGTAVALWIQDDGSQPRVYVRRLGLSSTAWSTAIPINGSLTGRTASFFPSCATLSIDGGNNALITWVDNGANSTVVDPSQIRAIKATQTLVTESGFGRIWTPTEFVSRSTRISDNIHFSCPQITMNALGNAAVAWTETTTRAGTYFIPSGTPGVGIPVPYVNYDYQIMTNLFTVNRSAWSGGIESARLTRQVQDTIVRYDDPRISLHLDDSGRKTLTYWVPWATENQATTGEITSAGYAYVSEAVLCNYACSYSAPASGHAVPQAIFASQGDGSYGISFYVDRDDAGSYGIRALKHHADGSITRELDRTPVLFEQDRSDLNLELTQTQFGESGTGYLVWRSGTEYRFNHFNIGSETSGSRITLTNTAAVTDEGFPIAPQFVLLNPAEEILSVWIDADGSVKSRLFR